MKRHTAPIGEIATVTSGGTPARENPIYWGGTIPWVKTTLVQNCAINSHDIDEHITEAGLKSSSAKLIPAGAILMAMVGQGKTREQVAILNVDAAISQNCAAIILKDGFDNRYVYQHFLLRYEAIRNASNSSGQQNLNAGLIRELRIPLAEFSAQCAVGQLLFEWDGAIEKTEQLIAAKSMRLDHLREHHLNKPKQSTRVKLHTVTHESTARNGKRLGREAIMAVTKQSGMRPMREETIAPPSNATRSSDRTPSPTTRCA